MSKTVVLSGARTPIGKFMGGFSTLAAAELGGIAIQAALSRAGAGPADVGYVFMGQVLQAGTGQITARQAAVKAGIGYDVSATTVNKVCLSGLNVLHLAHQMIQSGEADLVVAGGMESMTQSPYLLPKGRAGFRMGDASVVDSMMSDGLTCAFEHCSMGESTERFTGAADITRSAQDEFAAASHQRAARAQEKGLFDAELVSVSVPQRKRDPIIVSKDEGVRGETTADSLGKLRPAFDKSGTLTAGNASQISDGASAMILASEAKAKQLGVQPLAEYLGGGQVAGPDDTSLLHQPSNAIRRACTNTGVSLSDIALYEINEAFAAVSIASMRSLGVSADVVNVDGGAIALGHPLGMSGNRIAIHLIEALRNRGGGVGAAGLCGGGGQGEAALFKAL